MDDLEGQLFEKDLFGDPIVPPRPGPLAQRFLIPPFSIFDTRGGYWQDRKRAWINTGLKSELGRADELVFSNSLKTGDFSGFSTFTQTSIFDPVLCELLYRWFCPAGGQVVDPFAGGSVRGIVAGMMGRKYWGCDLRAEQVAANAMQAQEIVQAPLPVPLWVCGDSEEQLAAAPEADFILSCPPYGDLEKYSDDPRDLSACSWDDFFDKYGKIIYAAAGRLRQGSFAAFVVSNFRAPDGAYRDLVGTTSAFFQAAGLSYYNEGVLINVAGTVPVRLSAHFDKGRKLGKCHQNVLVFCKGSWRDAVQRCLRNEPAVDDVVDAFGAAPVNDLTIE